MNEEKKTEFLNNLMALLEKYNVRIEAAIKNKGCDAESVLCLYDKTTNRNIIEIEEDNGCSLN